MKINTIEEFNKVFSKYQIELSYKYIHSYKWGFYEVKYILDDNICFKVCNTLEECVTFAMSLIFFI